MFYLLLLSWNRDLCIIPNDMLLWLVQLEVKTDLLNFTGYFCLYSRVCFVNISAEFTLILKMNYVTINKKKEQHKQDYNIHKM